MFFTSDNPELQSNGLWRTVVNGHVFWDEVYAIAMARLDPDGPEHIRLLMGGKLH